MKPAINEKVAVIGSRLHVNILTSILEKAGFHEIPIYYYYRTGSSVRNIAMYAGLVKFIATNNRNGVLHIMYPSHKLSLKTALIAMKKGFKVVFHWIGSDIILATRRNYFTEYKRLFKHASHVTVAPWLKEELELLGVEAEAVVPLLPVDQIDQLSELTSYSPREFGVGYYLPKGKEAFYNKGVIEGISRLGIGIKVLIVGSDSGESMANVEYLGKIARDLMPSNFYKRIMVLVRMPVHDGFSQMVMETLLSGRFVLYNKPLSLPCVYYVRNEDEALSKLSDLYESYRNGELKPNPVCRNGLLEKYSPRKIALKLLNTWFT